MSDIARMNEVMERLELVADLTKKFENRKIAKYVENCIRTAYDDIQVECVGQLDHSFQVV